MAVVGVAGRYLRWPLLASAIGPTLYVFIAHPTSATARLRSALVGHGVAVATALASVAAFGLWGSASMSARGYPSLRQAGAAAVALGVTLGLLHLLRTHHAPAAATSLLIATGLAGPGKPLFGLLIGLAIVIAAGPVLARVPLGRGAVAGADRE